MYAKLILIGNLGRDPEMRYTPSGQPVTNMSVATTERWNNQAGEPQERTTWYRVAAFGKTAVNVQEYLHKGSRVFIEGRLNPDPKTGNPKVFERADGTFGASYEVTALTVKFLTPKSNGNGNGASEPAEVEAGVEEDTIPF